MFIRGTISERWQTNLYHQRRRAQACSQKGQVMDNKFDGKRISYGLTNELFANRKGEGETIILGGIGTGSSRWARVLSRRAAHQLWYRLTWLLFPEKSTQVTGMAQTAPLHPPNQTSLTTHFEIVRNTDSHTYDIMGWIGDDTWWFRVDDHNARHLWIALDKALYPAGWQGPSTHHGKLN